MRVVPINNQTFKSIYRHENSKFTESQNIVAKDITNKVQMPNDKYGNQSLVELLENEYNIDLCIDSNKDGKSVNLYLAEDVHLKDYKGLKKLTPVGNYDAINTFETGEVIEELDRTTFSKNTGIINTVATILFTLATVLIPVLSITALIKDRKTEQIENVIKHSTDTIKELPKDTLNIINKIK